MKIVRALSGLNVAQRLWAVPLVLVTLMPSAAPVMAQEIPGGRLVVRPEEQLLRTLTVTGQGKTRVQTTITQVQLGVEVQGKTAEEVQQEVARRSTAVVEFLKSRNVDKLQTTGISLNPQYDYSNNRQQIIGYIGSNSVSFRVPTERAGDILDQAVQAGASRIDSVSFVADDAAIETARQEAIRLAVQNAQAQATAALSSLNLTQQEIVSIQVGNAAPPPPIMARMAAAADANYASEAAKSQVVGGEQEVEAMVTLQIRY